MRCKILAGMAIVTLAAALSCSDDSGGDGDAGGSGGSGGSAGGSGGSSPNGGRGGSGGGAPGGSGGMAQGGSGGMVQGGAGGVAQGGAGGVAQGGAGGQKTCTVDKGGFMQDFEMASHLWEDTDGAAPASTALSTAQKHGGENSMEISFHPKPAGNADGGAALDAAAPAPRNFYIINIKDGLQKMAKYIQKGRTISIWVFLPEGNKVESVELGANSEAGFHFTWTGKDRLAPGMWHKLTHTFASIKQKVNGVDVDVDYDCTKPTERFQLGLAFNTALGQSWDGKVYVDDFEIAPAP